jgi:predicted permease
LGDDLHVTFLQRIDAARSQGIMPALLCIAGGLADTLASGFAERAADRRVRTQHAIPTTPVRSLPMTWESIVGDVSLAFRGIRKSPMFAAMIVVTLAIGIGANSAIFSAVYAALLKPLPYANPGDLVAVWSHQTKLADENYPVSPANYEAFRSETNSFTQLEGMYSFLNNLQVNVGATSETLQSSWVTAGMFRMLGRSAELGRGLQEGDETAVVLSHGYWQSRFGADPAIVGQTLVRTDGSGPLTIVGVMPEDFVFPYRSMLGPSGFTRTQSADVWLLLTPETGFRMIDAAGQPNRTIHLLVLVARLKPGMAFDRARADLETVAARRALAFPESNEGYGVTVRPLLEQTVGQIRPALMLLTIGVGILLLLTCANIANVLMARAAGQRRDFGVRVALGASRRRLLQQTLVASGVLSILGGCAALAVAAVGSQALLAIAPADLPRVSEAGMSQAVILFTFGLAVGVGLLTGLLPALSAIRTNPAEVITWINGVKFLELTDTEKRLPDTGGIALQVHGGGDTTKQFVRYRNIRVKQLD